MFGYPIENQMNFSRQAKYETKPVHNKTSFIVDIEIQLCMIDRFETFLLFKEKAQPAAVHSIKIRGYHNLQK